MGSRIRAKLPGMSRRLGPVSAATRRRVIWLPLGLALAFNCFAFLPEVTLTAPDLNDHVLHYALISRINDVWQDGGNPRDPWIPYWGEGFPLLRYYQHLPHLLVAFVFRLLRGLVPLYDLFKGLHFVLLVLAPVAFYLGSRWLGFEPLAASFAALCSVLLSASPDQRYFMGFQSLTFAWNGYGLFPQLAGMTLFAPALGALHQAVLTGRRIAIAVALLAALWLSHLVLGYIAGLLGLLILFRPETRSDRPRALLRIGVLYLATLGVAAYVIAPVLVESRFINRSIWESPDYWDSLGMSRVLAALFGGGLLDGPRLAVLTWLTLAGLALACWKSIGNEAQRGAARVAALSFVLALLIYFGRPTWGLLLKLLPFSDFLPLHRWICGLHYAALLLAGLTLAWLWEKLRWSSSAGRLAIAASMSLIVLGPALISQWRAASFESALRRRSAADLASGGQGLMELLKQVHRRDLERPGRAYAGTSWDWGRDYKLAEAPVSMFWSGHDISSISYMFHTMGRNSDLEVEFDPKRRAHYDLFNIRYLFHYDHSQLPRFADIFADRPGIYAAVVDTRGTFEVVGADLYFHAPDADAPGLLQLNRWFIHSNLHARGRFIRIGVDPLDHPREAERAVEPEKLQQLPTQTWRRPRGSVLSSWGHNDHFGATVQIEDPAIVLFRMTYHPNWRIWVDRAPAGFIMLSPSFIGIPIQPGRHQIELAYDGRDWTVTLFYLGIALLILIALGERFVRRMRAGQRSSSNAKRMLLEAAVVTFALAILGALADVRLPIERMPHPDSERWRLAHAAQRPN